MNQGNQHNDIVRLAGQVHELTEEIRRLHLRLAAVRTQIAALQQAPDPAPEAPREAPPEPPPAHWFQSAPPRPAPAPAPPSARRSAGPLSLLAGAYGEHWLGFDEEAYAYYNPDVAAAVAGGGFSSGFEHWLKHGRAERRSGAPEARVEPRDGSSAAIGTLPPGINYYSFLSSISGLGSASRGLHDSMLAAGIPLQPYDLPNWEEAGREAARVTPGPYRVNLIHQNADVLQLFADTYGQRLLAGRYNIAYSVWELPALRSDFTRHLRLVDEIWAPTEFCRRAFAAATPLPVVTIPHAIDRLEEKATLTRRDLDLPEGPFLFSLVFDVSSGFERKNPLAAIRAFRRTFGPSRDVILLLKCFNSRYAPSRWAELQETAAAPNIILLDERWSDAHIHSLHRVTDCLVSPHRAEGFGLNLAETMYFGNAVIGTAYGAVLDFMREDNSYLLDARPVEIEHSVGPYLKGNIWAEPSEDHLAELMARVVGDPAERKARSARGRAFIQSHFSHRAVGERIGRRLAELGLDSPAPARGVTAAHPAGAVRFLAPGTPAAVKREIRALRLRPIISVVTPVYDVEPRWLSRAIESVRAQHYPFWELCLCDDASTSEPTRQLLRQYQGLDPRIRIDWAESNSGIAGASNRAAMLASGEFIALLDNDDELTPDALLEVVRRLNQDPELDLLYSDEDKLNEAGERCDHYFKPDWSPEHLQSVMYLLHLLVVRKSLFLDLGGFRPQYSGAQDYDLALRIAGRTDRIGHIARVLYHWRMIPGSAAEKVDAKPAALDAGRRALADFVSREQLPASVEPGLLDGLFRVHYQLVGQPEVSLCIVAGNKHAHMGTRGYIHLLDNFVRSIVEKTEYRRFEIVVVHDNDIDPQGLAQLAQLGCRLVAYPGPNRPFNFAHKANFTVRQSRTEHMVLLNDDMEVLRPDWLSALLEYSQQPRIGAVGGRLLHADGSLQHAGVVLGVNGSAAHLFHNSPRGYIGYNAFTHVVRNYSAVTAACLATRLSVFEEAGGFDEAFAVDFNDIDFCLSLQQRGYRVVYTPYCELYHFEGQSLVRHTQDPAEVERFCRRWSRQLDCDPYYNPNLTHCGLDCAFDPARSNWRPGGFSA